ncbi:MAG: 50S ribosomal protein L28 [Candidatus Saganbacteria bacterium]|nr:50S ribosomal protein L28 [Candidatus Saganbacteria bacterium]
MSKKCFICRKKAQRGNNVSHSNRRTLRTWNPNIQKVNILVEGKKKKEYVCTKCLKAGKVKKAL